MVKAQRKGTVARFTEGIWKTGIPARAGWVPVSETETERVLPKEIVDMSIIHKETLPKQETAPEVKKKDVAAKSVNLKPTATSTLTARVDIATGKPQTAAAPKGTKKPPAKAKARPKAKPKTKSDADRK